jgi:hypothetical protein
MGKTGIISLELYRDGYYKKESQLAVDRQF